MNHFTWYVDETMHSSEKNQQTPKLPYKVVDHPDRLLMGEEAFQGVVGKLAIEIEKESEADHAAILSQLLICSGSIIGRTAHAVVEGHRHYLNLFAVLVGATSKARKGSSWSRVRQVIELVDIDWLISRQQNGLVSSEGLVHAIRDAVYGIQIGKNFKPTANKTDLLLDPGVDDKRLLSVEEEFISVMRHKERSGNTLSSRLREAWDGVPLGSLAKQTPDRCKNPHVSIIGHISPEELDQNFNSCDVFNGLFNRFLWLRVYRTKYIPNGSDYRPSQQLIAQLLEAIEWAKQQGAILRDPTASKLWEDVYPVLSDGKPGLPGAVLGRAEAQVLRLSTLYAVLDQSKVVAEPHLRAALAFWDYCERSVYLIFGNRLGNASAERVLEVLKQVQAMTRTDVTKLFNNNFNKEKIDQIQHLLTTHGFITVEKDNDTGGGPKEIWKLTKRTI